MCFNVCAKPPGSIGLNALWRQAIITSGICAALACVQSSGHISSSQTLFFFFPSYSCADIHMSWGLVMFISMNFCVDTVLACAALALPRNFDLLDKDEE